MATNTQLGVSASIQMDLDAGTPPEEIVQALMKRGLSQPTAQRFVDKALQQRSSPVAGPAAMPQEDAAKPKSSGAGDLISGAFWASLGCTVTATTYLMAKPGGTYTIAYGAVIVGLIALARGLTRWWATSRQFPVVSVLAVLAVPPLGAAAIVGYGSWRHQSRVKEVQAAEDSRLQEERATQVAERAVAARQAAVDAAAVRAQEKADAIQRQRDLLKPNQPPTIRCSVALELGNSRVPEAIPDLVEMLARREEGLSIRGCAASALVKLGETQKALDFFLECAASGDDRAHRMAIAGFGELGPSFAAVALPYFPEMLRSPYWDARYLAVDALSKIGPSAEPLLREAAQDSDQRVREAAGRALAAMRR
jgi:hypothetical protein